MDAIERIIERLRRRPDVAYKVSDRMVTVAPHTADGFTVSFVKTASEYIVAFDGWHEHFESEEDALNRFAFGLSDCCRLRVDLRGSWEYRWTVEERTAAGWIPDSTTGLLLYPYWRRMRTVYRQNAFITDEPASKR